MNNNPYKILKNAHSRAEYFFSDLKEPTFDALFPLDWLNKLVHEISEISEMAIIIYDNEHTIKASHNSNNYCKYIHESEKGLANCIKSHQQMKSDKTCNCLHGQKTYVIPIAIGDKEFGSIHLSAFQIQDKPIEINFKQLASDYKLDPKTLKNHFTKAHKLSLHEAKVISKLIGLLIFKMIDLAYKDYKIIEIQNIHQQTYLQLQESEAHYRTLINTVDAIICTYDINKKINFVNENCCRLLKTNSENILGKSIHDIQIINNKLYERMLNHCYETHEVCTFDDIGGIDNQENTIWLETTLHPRFDIHNNFIGVMEYSIDITTRKQNEITILNNENKYRALLHAKGTFLVVINTDDKITFLNNSLKEVIDIPSEELPSINYLLPLNETEEDKIAINKLRSLKTKITAFSIETRYKFKDNKIHWLQVHVTPQYNFNHEIIGAIIQGIDITKLKERESELKSSTLEYKDLANAGEILMLKYDKDYTITYLNTNVARFFNKRESDIIGKKLGDLITDKTVVNKSLTLMKSKRHFHKENYVKNAHNEKRWLSSFYTPLYSTDNEFNGYLCQIIDMTDRKNLEIEVEEMNALNNELVNSGDTMIWTTDNQFNFNFVNHQLEKFTGYSSKKILSDPKKLILHPQDIDKISKFNQEYAKNPKLVNIEMRWKYQKSEYRWVKTTIIPRFDNKHKCYGFIGKTVDIHDSYTAHQKIEKQRHYFYKLINSGETFVITNDMNGRITYANQPAKDFLSPDMEYSGVKDGLLQYIPKSMWDYMYDIYYKNPNKYANEPYLVQFIKQDTKEIFWFRCYETPLINDDMVQTGHIIQAINVNTEIQMNTKLADSEAYFRSFYENMIDIIFSLDTNGKILDVSPSVITATNNKITPKELINQNISSLSTLAGSINPERFLTTIFNDKFINNHQIRFIVDGEELLFSVNAQLITNNDGIPIRIVGALHNITEITKAERSLRESQLLYESVMENLPINISRREGKGEILFANKAFCESFGINDVNSIIGKKMVEVINILKSDNNNNPHRFNPKYLVDTYNQVLTTGETIYKDIDIPDISGNIHTLQTITSPVYNIKGQIIGTQDIAIDITELHQSIITIEKTNQQLLIANQQAKFATSLFDFAPIGYIVLDSSQKIIHINQAALQMGNISKEEVIHSHILKYYHQSPGNIKIIQDKLDAVSDFPDTAFNYTSEQIIKNNEKVFYSIDLIYSSKEQIYLCAFSDITKLISAKQHINKQTKTIENLFDLSPDGIITLNNKYEILQISQSAKELLNISSYNIINKPIKDFLSPDNTDNLIQIIKDTQTADFAIIEELVINDSEDKHEFLKVIELSAKSVQIEEGNNYIMLNIRDITDRKQMTQAMISNERLVSLGEMATAMAHEINQPLLSISLALDNLFDRINRRVPQEKEYINKKSDRIFGDIHRIGRLIDHVRAYARNNKKASGQPNDRFGSYNNEDTLSSSFNINHTVKNAITIMGEQLKQHGFILNINLNKDIPDLIGNTFELEQVIINLLSNAKDTLNEKEKLENNKKLIKEISIKSDFDSKNIYIYVTDNGLGIKKANQEKVLQPFFTTKGDRGVGVGLSISMGIINKFNGAIKIDSDEKTYTTFTVSIPIPHNI